MAGPESGAIKLICESSPDVLLKGLVKSLKPSFWSYGFYYVFQSIIGDEAHSAFFKSPPEEGLST